jgi:hypothetical protein
MYAVRIGSPVYHLYDSRNKLTVCGLRVSKMVTRPRTVGPLLRRTPTQPLDKILCKNCVRLAQPEYSKN